MSAAVVITALVAGALGALIRYGIAHAFRAHPARLPWAVLLVNLLGSFLAGIVVALTYDDPSGALRLILVGGFAGGLTTFSTFSVETVQLAIEGRWRTVIGSVLGNVLGGLAAFGVAFSLTAFVGVTTGLMVTVLG
jgi:CrcB protein